MEVEELEKHTNKYICFIYTYCFTTWDGENLETKHAIKLRKTKKNSITTDFYKPKKIV